MTRLPKAEAMDCGLPAEAGTPNQPRFFKGGADVPPRNLYDETSGELKAKVDLQPSMLAAEAAYRPQYTSLDLSDLETLLNGTQAGTKDQQYTDYEEVPAEYSDTATGGRWSNGSPMSRRVLVHPAYQQPVLRSRTIDTPAQRGLLDILQNDLQPASDRLTADSLSRQRSSEIGDVETLGPRAVAAYKAANPEQQALLDRLNAEAQSELDAGANLDPGLRREVQQNVRAGQAARGMGFGMGDLAQEGLFTGQAAEQLRRKRQEFAQGMVGLNQATGIDPFMATLGRPAINLNQSNGLLGQGLKLNASAGPQLFGSTVNANDVFSSNANAANANAISSANNDAAMTGAGISAGTSLAAAGIFAAVL